ncbi:MAG TPA: DMT family transporter [Ferruginibacter sp.]|nr:DMT family transporter [Ferruginibacter sp.]HRE62748.1 DMT family transporter [Ferruginibacter sp.]
MQKPANSSIKWLIAGLLFAILWPSASTATKAGLTVAQPLVIAIVRFALAAAIMLFVAHIVKGYRLPLATEWKQIAIYGLLNISIYLGCYVVAMQTVTAGIGSLAIATNPVFISFLSVFFLKHKMQWPLLLSLIICSLGVICASWPLFGNASVTVGGLLLLLFSMLCYSTAAIYFSSKNWNGLSLLTINGWQTFLGGLFLLPLALWFYQPDQNHFDKTFWISVSWLAIPVSIIAVQIWLWLLSINPVRAGLWLFLCPLFGFIIAACFMGDKINYYTIAGIVLVLLGLLLSKINIKKREIFFD